MYSLARRHAAVDVDGLAGDVLRFVRGQEHHQVADVLRLLLALAAPLALAQDLYDVLGVLETATDREIKAAYRKQSLQHHPDKVSGEEEKVAATKRFTEIAEAYEILSDDEKRGKYDRGEEIKPEGQQQGSPFQNPFAQHMHFRH